MLSVAVTMSCTGSEMLSHWMLAKFFQPEIDRERQLNANPMLSFEKEFLRWMLSDGAGALRLENQPRGDKPLKLEWVDVRSYANEADTCMYVGAEKSRDGELRGWSRFEPEEWLARSIFSVKQDTRLLGERMIRHGIQFALESARKLRVLTPARLAIGHGMVLENPGDSLDASPTAPVLARTGAVCVSAPSSRAERAVIHAALSGRLLQLVGESGREKDRGEMGIHPGHAAGAIRKYVLATHWMD